MSDKKTPEMRPQMVGEPDAAYEWYAQTHLNWVNEMRQARQEIAKLENELDLAQSGFNSALKAMDRNDERRGREYARFLMGGAASGEPSAIAIKRIFEIVNRAYSGTLCNFASVTDAKGAVVSIVDVICECQSAAENNLLDVTGVDMNGGEW